MANNTAPAATLDTGTYDIIRNRLTQHAGDLAQRLNRLNAARKSVFGAIDTALVANDRIHTGNYCTARDMVAVGQACLFGYNVHVGLRSGIQLADVFSVYRFEGQRFKETDMGLLADEKFIADFLNLYRYYKDAYFARFSRKGSYLYMVFHLNEKTTDFKAFKWLVTDDGLQYVDNRSDHEVRLPDQYEFRWRLATRDDQRSGRHPHVSIMDRVFVETVGGDLTIKVEDNTNQGLGIYSEPVEYPDQTLDDAEFAYADLGNLIALRIRPYQEEARYFVFNDKIQQVERVNGLSKSGILLPEGQGLIFANGYYLQTGEYKLFEKSLAALSFKKRIASGNGEDYLFVFYDLLKGTYVLLPYNIITQQVATPIVCNGFTVFPDGELCYFRAEDEPTKHHVMQIWQTPFASTRIVPEAQKDSYLFKIGNKDIVKAMAECQEILTLSAKEDTYANLYDDLVRRTTQVLDAYYWIDDDQTQRLAEALRNIRETAQAAIEEYEKKVRTQRQTEAALQAAAQTAARLFDRIRRERMDNIEVFVQQLAALRALRGELLGLKQLPFTQPDLITKLEGDAATANEKLSEQCVAFLLQPEALLPYQQQIDDFETGIGKLTTAKAATDLEEKFEEIGIQLELLVEMVTNLKIADATQTTRIIDAISVLFTQLNQHKAVIRQQAAQLRTHEASAEFGAQIKLLDQSLINYIALADTPARCDEFLTKMMVQLEELDSKFAEVDAFTVQLAEKREEVYAAMEGRKSSLVEARNNRTTGLAKAAERIFSGIKKRSEGFKTLTDVNGFFAADLMVDKVRDIITQLQALEDSNKADRIQTQLKALQEDALRTLRDKQDLYVTGENVIQLGRHRFSVNTQPLELTVVNEGNELVFHLTGTNFYAPVQDEVLAVSRAVWQQHLVSENEQVYRAEYLAYQLLAQAKTAGWPTDWEQLLPHVQQAAAGRYAEGYTKGIHDEDACRILQQLYKTTQEIGLLAYTPEQRAMGELWWKHFATDTQRANFGQQLDSAKAVVQVFPGTQEFAYLKDQIREQLREFAQREGLFPEFMAVPAAAYLFAVFTGTGAFVTAQAAWEQYEQLGQYLRQAKAWEPFQTSITALEGQPREQYLLTRKWIQAFLEMQNTAHLWPYQDEIALIALGGGCAPELLQSTPLTHTLTGMRGEHAVLDSGQYTLDYHALMAKMQDYVNVGQPLFEAFMQRKRQVVADFRADMQLEEFTPKVLSSFVRNRLIDQVYLPIFGDNMAKQLGTAGEQTRTDRMGLLLLLSPPGYGKTTLMEYIAQRLGLIFVKVNGPAIGHRTLSLSPQDAPSLAARKELEKLNLALEMGDNIMLYVDDIQHCHPEFLQQFISLCDAQRKIEGVYQGCAKTYDLRGRRVAVVMAGNPYTESGERFQIPDMLANRADIYNLGDIIGDAGSAFKLSYLENALTSNPALAPLAMKSRKDVYALIEGIEMGRVAEVKLEGSYSSSEVREYVDVLQKMMRVRDVVLLVNQAYIQSAATADAYRTEPAFKLQGSYRNMNKLAEKVSPIMNDQELQTLLLAHYEGEAQTLTSDAEANFLKLKSLMGALNDAEAERWASILETYRANLPTNGADSMERLLAQLNAFNAGLENIKQALENRKG